MLSGSGLSNTHEIPVGVGKHGSAHGNVHDRKTKRKVERQIAKEKKAQHFKSNRTSVKRQANTELETNDAPGRKRRRLNVRAALPDPREEETRNSSKISQKSVKDTKLDEGRKKTDVKGKGKANAEETLLTKPIRTRQEVEEDVYISMLEKRLGIDKKKIGKGRYSAAFEDDGLLGEFFVLQL